MTIAVDLGRKATKQTKTINHVNFCPCLFHTHYVMFSSLEDGIRKVSDISTSGNYIFLNYKDINRPVQAKLTFFHIFNF